MNILWTAGTGLLAIGIVAFCIWRALGTVRTPQGAAAWVIFLLSAPWFAVPAYAVFGGHRIRSYTRSRQRSRALTSEQKKSARYCPPDSGAAARLAVFERIVNLPVVGGNSGELLIDGEASFAAMFEAIDGARHTVCVQFYTIVDDATGQAFAERLIAAARRGVAVRLLFDGVGSYGLSRAYRGRLSEAGIQVVEPRGARGPTSRLNINFRNHRKTLVVDGVTGFVGGHNVSDTYVGRNPRYGHWRDTHLRLQGPIVAQLQLIFTEDWHWGTGELLTQELNWDPGTHEDDMTAVLLPTGPADAMETGTQTFFATITAARKRLWIASPYFVPDASIQSALSNAALKGVDVRVILTGTVDHYLPWLAAHAFFDEIRSDGVQIYHYKAGFMHQKIVLCDEDVALVGTANCDVRSFRLNFETMAAFADTRFAGAVARMLEDDLAVSERYETPLEEEPLWIRTGAKLARLLAPVL
ncbi:cardiolipin synthase [Allosediminivita pacifica]|uniref:Cardiolipin synthase n=1 Tax=Allosediminivita pacifica TaxID=1267769 RepID=A0A2T6AUK9_9RHOB|nr:cardiolipin synthase [Allosediminivita pacifica]PTX47500.1 cardiolipin synthase [Allosediminivita pacifica]GGB14653.1 cardiolipin synthase A [Allosediminivita pacifica]